MKTKLLKNLRNQAFENIYFFWKVERSVEN